MPEPANISGAGTPFRQALWERIFQRLGMFDSVPAQNVDDSTADDRVQFDSAELDRFGGVLRRLAVPYRVSGSSATVNTSVNKSVDAATGAISTVLDLAKFDSAIDVWVDGCRVARTRSLAGALTGEVIDVVV